MQACARTMASSGEFILDACVQTGDEIRAGDVFFFNFAGIKTASKAEG